MSVTLNPYVGGKIIKIIKIIKAGPMSRHAFKRRRGEPIPADEEDVPGYLVQYPDGYESWSPAETFEQAYRRVSTAERQVVSELPTITD